MKSDRKQQQYKHWSVLSNLRAQESFEDITYPKQMSFASSPYLTILSPRLSMFSSIIFFNTSKLQGD